ncbi:MAG TPA: NADH-dependent [FeFe] hydrogenase, group A6, partial [bacterium]|nr:NADH-dependent [FeFe] hydrogenase, group A6 [bacterium]
MKTITVNGKQIPFSDNETILSAVKHAGIKIPTLCHIEELLPTGSCRICVVEDAKTGALIPSCSFPATDNMSILTNSAKVIKARKTIVELLLASHPDDCLYCDRNLSCALQTLAEEHGVRQRKITAEKIRQFIDSSSPSIMRDPEKCILCGKCVRTCEEIQGVSALDFSGRGSKSKISTAFNVSLNLSTCVACGQCVNACPTGALVERSSIREVIEALQDPEKTVVIQHAPAVSVSLAEDLGLEPGVDIAGIMTAALKQIGFDHVFDTSFSADLTIMEEATELVERITKNGVLPMITSCSPAWIKFAETFYPDLLPNVSSCKSPQQMLGSMIKNYWAPKMNIPSEKVFSVSVMPCTAKKFEIEREEMVSKGISDIDAVLTTRELAKLIRMYSVDVKKVAPAECDLPFGERSSAGKLFGASGGVMEAAIRTAYWMITGRELENLVISELRDKENYREITVDINGLKVKAAVVSGLGNARLVLDKIIKKECDLHFLEIMSCPGGCINGGGQPRAMEKEAVRKRMQALYSIDSVAKTRVSHKNSAILDLYEVFLKKPGSHKAHELLHTTYQKRT